MNENCKIGIHNDAFGMFENVKLLAFINNRTGWHYNYSICHDCGQFIFKSKEFSRYSVTSSDGFLSFGGNNKE